MSRLFWVAVGAAATVIAIRKSRTVIEAHTPPGVAQAAGVVTGLGGALKAARSEFSAGLAERESELRRGLLGDADVDAARARTDAWRAERADRKGRHADPDDVPGRTPSTAPRAEDPDDGDLGYSF